MPLSPELLPTLRAMLDRLIPRDDFPGATDAGVDAYVLRQLEGDCAHEKPLIESGLQTLDAAALESSGRKFAALDAAAQDSLLTSIERGATRAPSGFFARMVELAAEGFYADPAQGGNRDEVSWKMVGYQRRVPERPTAP